MFQIEEVKIASVTIEDRARVEIKKDKIESLKKAIKRVGQLDPIKITSDKRLLDGHRRIIAMTELGLETITARIMPDLDFDQQIYIEYIANKEREDFLWHEELCLKRRLHDFWKAEAEKIGNSWGYRETSEKLECAIGGLSTDLKLSDAIIKYPDLQLTSYDNKTQAWQAFKKICDELSAIHSMDSLPEEEKARLEKLRSGTFALSDNEQSPATHADLPPGMTQSPDGSPTEQTGEQTEISSEQTKIRQPKAIYLVSKYEDFIPQVPDYSVGFVELDPPYAIDYEKNYGNIGKRKATENDWTVEQLQEFYLNYLPLIHTKMLDNSWVLCWTGIEHWQMANEFASKAGFEIQSRPGIWIKPGGECNTPKTTLISNYEMFVLFRKGKATFNTPSFKATIDCNTTSGTQKIHQWEKPFDLYKKIFPAMARSGSIFLSPFAGSGNSMIVAEQFEMISMGCDIRDKYFYNFYDRYNKFFMGE